MPNWCVNQLDITGDEAEVARLIELVKGDQDGFDFAKIVPIPDSPYYAANETQNHFQCGCVPVYVELPELPEVKAYTDSDGNDVMRKQGEWRVGDLPVYKIEQSNGTIQDSVGMMFGGNERCPIHRVPKISSHPDWWYNWNVANWGTKWNCGEVWHDRDDDKPVDGKTSYNFDTAWSPAEPIAAALAEQFPTLSITHRFCEGAMGFAGEVEYANGDVVSRKDYDSDLDKFPDEAWVANADGSRGYERDYDAVPMSEFESFCDEHFGGIVGG